MGASARDRLEVNRGDLAPILYVRELAAYLGRSEKAVRNAVARGTLPAGRRLAGRLAWTREDVLSWLSETRGVSRRAETPVKISANPYPRDPARFLVTFELPTTDTKTARRRVRKVAPFGLDEAGAIVWGQSQLGEVLRANRVYVPPALLALLFLAIMLAFWLIPHDAEAITPIFRHAGR